MNILLDTHALIWFVEDDEKLPDSLKVILNEKSNSIYISIASLWEMAIKISLNKLSISVSFDEVIELVKSNGFEILQISEFHLSELLKLPFIHRDPFDRLLAAQASFEDLLFVSCDEIFNSYNVRRLWD